MISRRMRIPLVSYESHLRAFEPPHRLPLGRVDRSSPQSFVIAFTLRLDIENSLGWFKRQRYPRALGVSTHVLTHCSKGLNLNTDHEYPP